MPGETFDDLGPNTGLVEELWRQFQDNPSSVGEAWRDFFEDYHMAANPLAAPVVAAPAATTTPTAPAPVAPAAPSAAAVPVRPSSDGTAEALRGAAARVVANMEASLGVPTATSVRPVPATLLEANRRIVNNHVARTRGGKLSFTHVIGFAVVRALAQVPAMNASFDVVDGVPSRIVHPHVNLGLAVDVTRPDGRRTLLVPNVPGADAMDFATFFAAYEDVVRRVRNGKITPDDFAGTTITLTNPGTLGTVHSVPRLMPGQGCIVGVGAIAHPAEYEGADPRELARLGIGKTVTLTSTYDHRIIQGAESGEFLGVIHRLLLGGDEFYEEIFESLGVPYVPYQWSADHVPGPGTDEVALKQLGVSQLVNMYRVRGHLIADIDPLRTVESRSHPELDPINHGLTIWDLEREFATEGATPEPVSTLRNIITALRDAYARTVGIEYMHIQEPDQKAWIQQRVEGVTPTVDAADQHRILDQLTAAEVFERFLHTKYLGHKRFSLEGAESLVPMLDALLSRAADDGIEEVVLGAAHRGRLNLLANVVGKSYAQIFREFEGQLDPAAPQGSGDVKYHLGAHGVHTSPSGTSVQVRLASNPSHLEAVDPVVEGIARALGDTIGDDERRHILPVLVHGDAAFAGQGVVAETFNLSEVEGYDVGGTVHLVVNNQLGFTTSPESGRSGVYATDVAKMVQAPILHVNGDDPEACVRVTRMAFDFRQAFRKDVVVDLVCYRRYGHNETDEPAFTQPKMYERIDNHRSVRKLYTERLVNRGDITLEEAERALQDFRARLETAFADTHDPSPDVASVGPPPISTEHVEPPTAVARGELLFVAGAVTSWPEHFHPHPKLARILQARASAVANGDVEWAVAELLAFGALLRGGVPVRLAGQDTRRGTFSQRHGVLVDVATEEEWIPLSALPDAAPFMLYDSVLSEYAALGFDYGYSLGRPEALVCWEAQFGDFANAAQVVVDQFIVAAADKWGQESRLTLLLPHGYEGQGPEHSSARIERFLQLAADDQLRVAYPSTAAQYFHLLRRQALMLPRRPLVVFTPKRYLRMPSTVSPISDLETGRFEPVIDDAPGGNAELVLLCTGKVAHELAVRRVATGAVAAIVRVEQLAPWPALEVVDVLARHAGATVRWVQEEPSNMGAWTFVRDRLAQLVGHQVELVAREESASPATGSQTVHEREQAALLDAAFAST